MMRVIKEVKKMNYLRIFKYMFIKFNIYPIFLVTILLNKA